MQSLVVACALLGVAFGQYTGVPVGYTGYPGYQGYQGYQGYRGYDGHLGYPGYTGYQGYPGYQGYNGYRGWPNAPIAPLAVKPIDSKVKEAPESVKPVVSVIPTFPAVPSIVPVASKTSFAGLYPAIRSQTQASSIDGSYQWSFDTENGIAAAEASTGGSNVEDHNTRVVAGEYSYTAPDGTPIHVRYTADADGFHPEIISTAYAGGYYGGLRGAAVPVETAAVVPVVAAEAKEETVETVEAEKKE